jgi:hypothetical protein
LAEEMKTAFVCLSDYIAPEPLQLMIIILIYCGNFPITGTQDFLFAMAARFGNGAGGGDEVWTTSCTTQPSNLDENAGLQSVINDVIPSIIMVWSSSPVRGRGQRIHG